MMAGFFYTQCVFGRRRFVLRVTLVENLKFCLDCLLLVKVVDIIYGLLLPHDAPMPRGRPADTNLWIISRWIRGKKIYNNLRGGIAKI